MSLLVVLVRRRLALFLTFVCNKVGTEDGVAMA